MTDLVYRVIGRLHEPIMPVGSGDHSITGNITAGSFAKLMRTQREKLPAPYRLDQNSVYIDLGSGMGRPVLSMATLPIRLSAGIEMQEAQVRMSRRAQAQLAPTTVAPVRLMHGNLERIFDLEPATHAHMFLWVNPALLRHVAQLLAWSETLKVVTIIHRGTPSELRDLGLLGNNLHTRSECTHHLSVTMPGNHSYGTYVLCMTPERRQRMRSLLPRPTADPTALRLEDMLLADPPPQEAPAGMTLRSKRTLRY